ncbi:hypothetical protein ACF0H5_024390 [Mactra antiquata]
MEGLVCIAWLLCFCFSWQCIKGVTVDPCVKHTIFDEDSIGSRNEKCSRPSPAQRLCDYRLNPGWYSIPHNGFLLNKCPTSGECGTEFPVWMQGNVPSVTEGIVNRTGCIKVRCACCDDSVTIQVKNCSNKVVYYLPTLEYCDSVYCIDDDIETGVWVAICIVLFISGGLIGFAVSIVCNRYRCQRRPSSKTRNSVSDVSPCKPNTPPPPYDTRLNNVHGGQQ